MNIWIVNHYAIPPSMGGLVRHYYFSKYLQQKGHKVKIFTSSKIHNTDINMIKDGSLYYEEMEDGVEYTFVKSRDYKGNGFDRILNMIDMPFEMWKAMKCFWKKEKPDVIYTSSPDLFVAFFALLFGRKHKIPVVVEVRDLWPESIVEYNNMSRKNPIIQVLYQLEKWIYIKADQLIFTMAGGKDYILDKGWDKYIDLNKVNHINNGVDLEEFEDNLRKFKIHDEDLEDDKFKIVYVGSIRKVNNLKSLIDAAQYIREEDNISILIYGDGTEREDLERICKERNLCVKFKGYVEKKYVPYILSKADLNLINVRAVNLNKYGCSWNKLFEYMASKKPILCNTPTSYDLIKEKNIGISQKFASAESYGKCLKWFSKLTVQQYNEYCENAENCAIQYDYKKLNSDLERILKRA
ncbi:glycosyltransferase family 4 protein [Faecalicatena contorta]|uniref:glycosyltransferase family 4 protein n=1 Tax=Faecalicatena contorta TaxID=39482 RepID=UPI001F2E94E2|nr:glycosyltransferase family 4 protein [Faecalicatena contorta]MCF2555879.1 glycosyltransferase family 4 protein [Faecalicatena contorta]